MMYGCLALLHEMVVLLGLLAPRVTRPPAVCALQAACWQGFASWTTLRTVALLNVSLVLAGATNMFSGLFVLHTLLAATGQTTYEMIKGAVLASICMHSRPPLAPSSVST